MTQATLAAGASLGNSPQGSSLLLLQHPDFSAHISLDGGQLIHWQQPGQPPLLYLSPLAQQTPGKAIRGGVPVCWPWFGPHPQTSTLPQHGVARTARWVLRDVTRSNDGFSIELLGPDHHGLQVESCLLLDANRCEITLTTHNHGTQSQHVSAALHSYLALADAQQAEIHGLAHSRFSDKLNNTAGIHQQDALGCAGELDRIVYGISGVRLIDPVWQRQVLVENGGSDSMVLWNPGAAGASRLADLPDAAWRDFVCIEAANAEDDARELGPGESHTLATRLTVMPL